MGILRIEVLIGGANKLADTLANRNRIFVFSGSIPQTGTAGVAGNIRARPTQGQYAYDLNAPLIANTISVTSYSAAQFSSDDLKSQPNVAGHIATAIEGGYIKVTDESAPIAGQAGAAASMAAAAGGLITVSGLTGMVNPDSVGRYLTISGAANAANNGRFLITAVNSANSVVIQAGAAPGADANNLALSWTEQGVVMDRAALLAYT